jgi:hypothetical protein
MPVFERPDAEIHYEVHGSGYPLPIFAPNMFGGEFVVSVSRDFVSRCPTPLLLQPGTDTPAPNLEIQKDWRAPTHLAESIRRVTDFLARQTPA